MTITSINYGMQFALRCRKIINRKVIDLWILTISHAVLIEWNAQNRQVEEFVFGEPSYFGEKQPEDRVEFYFQFLTWSYLLGAIFSCVECQFTP